MSIRLKVNIIFVVIIIMMSSISLCIHYVLTKDIHTYDRILATFLAANKLPEFVQEVYQDIETYQDLPSQPLRSRIENNLSIAGELVQTIQNDTPSDHADSLSTIEGMTKMIDSITEDTAFAMQLIDRQEVNEALLDNIDLLDRAVELSRGNIDAYLAQELEHTVPLRKEIIKKIEWLKIGLFGSVLAFSLAALLLGMLFANKWVIFPLRHIVASVRNIATGELDTSVPHGGNDEIGALASDIERMRASIKEMTENLKERERLKRILSQIANVFLTVPDEEMFGDVLAIVLQVMKSKYGIFGFIAGNGDLVIPSLTSEVWNECQVSSKSIAFPPDSWGDSLWGRAIREQKPLFSDGPFHTPEGHVHIDFFLSVPIIFGNDTIGLFAVANKENEYTEEDQKLLESIAGYTSPILNARLQRDRKVREQEGVEKALRESEERYRRLFENATEGIFVTTPAGRYVSVNPSTAKMFRYSSPKDMMDSVTDIGKQIYANPEDRLTVKRMLEEHGKFEGLEVEMVRKDKTRIWISMNIHVIRDEQGKILYYDGTCVDITERKHAAELLRESEERLRLTLAATQIGIFDWDIVNDRWLASTEYYTTLGYPSKNGFADREEWLARVYPDDRAIIETKLRAVLAGESAADQTQAYEYEARIQDADGTYRWQYVKGFGVKRDSEGRWTRILGIRMDIDKRKRAEEALRRLNLELDQRVLNRTAQLEAANKELEAFAYSVSHDLRAPLRHIDGFLELLQKRAGRLLDEKSRHYMYTISDATKKMGLLIDDLLSFSRMGRQAMSFQQVALEEVVRDIICEFEPDTVGKAIDWRIGDLPPVKGDASMLRMVMANLIANALKFTRFREKACIEIGSRPGQSAETVIYIRDNGVGFDMAYADKLFGVFQRLHRVEEFEGTGIGLANVRRIIARHGGRTWAEGEPDRGATFYFSLPRSIQGA